MTAANASFEELLAIAQVCDCRGVELRNDLKSPLFGGIDPLAAAQMSEQCDLKILALAEVKSFNHLSARTVASTEQLAAIGKACGAEAIVLIPSNDGSRTDEATRKKDLQHALSELKPVLESYGITGFIEPLGFTTSSVRSKREVVDAIESLDASHCMKLVHDTFHHFLAGESEIFAQHTGMVHISGVVNTGISADQMQDMHRVFVTSADRLQNLEQLAALDSAGYHGPISMEAFATEIHNLPNPAEQLRDSFQFISSGLAARVA